jgi:ribosomal protein S6--L-glutamate ligase
MPAVHLTILSRSTSIYTTRRLAEAARARGHRARVLDPVQIEMKLGEGAPSLFHRRRAFPRTDAVIPRIAPSVQQYGLAVVNQLELRGAAVLNGARAIAASRNKMECLQLLAANGVGVPRTVMASDASGLRDMVRHVGGVPVLVKLLSPSGRPGLMICETLQSLEAALEAILGLGQNIVVQQYVKGARGSDLRAIVVGGRVVAALRRRARPGRLARTLARGANFERAELTPRQARGAVEAARVVGLEVCAVDLLDVKGRPLVFEVNSSPGIREAEEACGVDVAAAIVARAEELVPGARPAAARLARRAAAAPRA